MTKTLKIPALAISIVAIIYFTWKWLVGVRVQNIIAKTNEVVSDDQADLPNIVAPVSPLRVRGCDGQGCGDYGASRYGGKRKHKGLDFVVQPGQVVVSPIDGRIKRAIDVYGDGQWHGLYIEGEDFDVKIFYLYFDPSVLGQTVTRGDVIAQAANIGDKYPSITPHIHVETWVLGSVVDPYQFFENLL